MRQRSWRYWGRQVIQIVMVSGCVMTLLTGCSSRLRTTIVSAHGAQSAQVAQVKSEPMVVEEIVAEPIQEVETLEVQAIDIPIEEPARAVVRPKSVTEIFATPKSSVASVESFSPSESVSSPVSEPKASSVPQGSEPSMQGRVSVVPPISFEPELPALPTLRQDSVAQVVQEDPRQSDLKSQVEARADVPLEPESLAEKEPMLVAKVVPQEPEQMEIPTKVLEAALSDIYFDYDQFAIREDASTLLKANARLLSEQFAEKHIVIEGHCDQRGTQSYNMVLGERRAKAVKHFLQDLGVPVENLQVVSYGKEKPFCTEQSEDCWQENRRGHFVIK